MSFEHRFDFPNKPDSPLAADPEILTQHPQSLIVLCIADTLVDGRRDILSFVESVLDGREVLVGRGVLKDLPQKQRVTSDPLH